MKFPCGLPAWRCGRGLTLHDGHLYVAGLKGWQSNAGRARTGSRTVHRREGVHCERHEGRQGRRHLTFTQKLDPKIAGDPENYAISRWNYKRSSAYGSPTFKVSKRRARQRGRECYRRQAVGRCLGVRSLGKTLRPCDQQLIKFNIDAADGTNIRNEIMHTIRPG